jgi:hypothetical protein
MADIPQWWMKGDWFDVCSCNIPCPCTFAQAPTNNHCDGLFPYHIREGEYGGIKLDDLTIIGVSRIDGNFWTRGAAVTHGIFIDERADERQREAIQQVFSGKAGGFMAKFAELLGPGVQWVEFVPITFEVADGLAYWRVEIPGKLQAFGEPLTGPTTPPGARVQLLNAPGSETGPGQVCTWGRAKTNSVNVPGFQWNWAGKSSKHIPFDWTGP